MSSNISVPRLLSRKTVSARGGITSQVIHAPGVGGMVTDVPSWQLKTTPVCQVPFAQDIIFPAGVAAVRGAPMTVTSTGIANITGLTGAPYGILYDSNSKIFHGGDSNSLVNNSQTSSVAQTLLQVVQGAGGAFIPFVVWGDEVLWFCQDGISSVLRTTSLALSNQTTVANALTFTSNTTAVTVATGGFNAINSGAWYIQYSPVPTDSGTYTPFVARVRTVQSDVSAAIDFPPALGSIGINLNAKTSGHIGLTTTVSDMGTATAAAGNITGQGTQWNTSGIGYGIVARGDIFTYKGSNTSWGVVASVPTTNTFTTNATCTGTAQPYAIRRCLVGTHGCVYNGRLWVVGCAWQRRRLYYSPLTSSTESSDLPQPKAPSLLGLWEIRQMATTQEQLILVMPTKCRGWTFLTRTLSENLSVSLLRKAGSSSLRQTERTCSTEIRRQRAFVFSLQARTVWTTSPLWSTTERCSMQVSTESSTAPEDVSPISPSTGAGLLNGRNSPRPYMRTPGPLSRGACRTI